MDGALQSSLAMPDTGERREITGRVNAKETEVVQQSKKLASRTKELSAKIDAKNRLRGTETDQELNSPHCETVKTGGEIACECGHPNCAGKID
jgi:hypothetical protein